MQSAPQRGAARRQHPAGGKHSDQQLHECAQQERPHGRFDGGRGRRERRGRWLVQPDVAIGELVENGYHECGTRRTVDEKEDAHAADGAGGRC